MYQLIIPNQVKKEIKRLDKSLLNSLIVILEDIAEHPKNGEPLRGDLSHLRKWSFNHLGIEYRIAYQINDDRIEVLVLKVGTRENFYADLK